MGLGYNSDKEDREMEGNKIVILVLVIGCTWGMSMNLQQGIYLDVR